jgi:Intracellular proteinase inhibitor
MVRSTIILCLILLILCGCSDEKSIVSTNTDVKESEKEEVEEKEDLELLFDVSIVNNKAQFIITLTNNSNELKKLEFPSSQKYEIIITDDNDQEVYRYSEGRMFTQAIEYALIKQNESIQWEEQWEYKNLTPGIYKVTISILANNEEELVATKSLQIP